MDDSTEQKLNKQGKGVDYYDRKTQRIGLGTWGRLLEDIKYKRVKLSKLWWGGRVSTVWLGLDHRLAPGGPPLIFETMVFGPYGASDLDMKRYSFLEHAEQGHQEMIDRWSSLQFVLSKGPDIVEAVRSHRNFKRMMAKHRREGKL